MAELGLLLEMNKAQSVAWNINRACRRFEAKFDRKPEVVELHPSVELDVEVSGLLVVRRKDRQPGHILVRLADEDESVVEEQCQINFGKPQSANTLAVWAGSVLGQPVTQRRMW